MSRRGAARPRRGPPSRAGRPRRERRPDLLRGALAAHREGRIAEAGDRYRQFLELNPDHVQALQNHALLLAGAGDAAAALAPMQRAVSLAPDDAAARNNLGNMLRATGRLTEAVSQYEAALAADPGHRNARFNLGAALDEAGEHAAAVQHLEAVAAHAPGDPTAWLVLGNALRDAERLDEAMDCYARSAALDAGSAALHLNRGIALGLLRRNDEAVDSLRRAVALAPASAEAHCNLGLLLYGRGDLADAESHCREAIRLRPDYSRAHFHLGNVLLETDRSRAAIPCFRRVVEIEPGHAMAWVRLGQALLTCGQLEPATEALDEALELDPDNPGAWTGRGMVRLDTGDFEDANRCFERALETDPTSSTTWLGTARARKYGPDDDATVERVESLLEQPGLTVQDEMILHFALGKMHDDRGAYERAFAHLREGNSLARRRAPFDFDEFDAHIAACVETYDREFFDRRRDFGDPTRRPIFIVGMPRSGTSLVEQILASHPDVFGAGELIAIPQLVRGATRQLGPFPDCLLRADAGSVRASAAEYLSHLRSLDDTAERVTDKLPGNFMHLGFIHLLFPNAVLLQCVRDPIDVCVSNYVQLFGEGHIYAYGLRDLGMFHRRYTRLMAHWHEVLPVPIHQVRYEDLVAEQEERSRWLVEQCGLPWDDRCLRFHENRRVVHTASAWQVRRPMYKSSVAGWRRYEPWIGELLEALEKG